MKIIRMLGRILTVLVVFVLVIALASGGAFYYFTRQSFPQTDGTLRLPGLNGDVTVIRDKFGVPHLYADTPLDLFRAQGFVHAQDRYFQMEFWRRIGQGRIAELFGKSALSQDKFIRTLGWGRIAAANAAQLSPELKGTLEAYADGVNAYALANPDKLGFEFKVLGLIGRRWQPEPWKPENSLTWAEAMAWSLGGNMDVELLRAALIARGGQELADALLPAYPSDAPVTVPTKETGDWRFEISQQAVRLPISTPGVQSPISRLQSAGTTQSLIALYQDTQEVAQSLGLLHGSEIGSNNWVIGGARTTTGKPILANDPHLGIQMPSIWYQVGLHCRVLSAACPYDVVGVSFAGVPGVVIGHNNRIAWGVTNLGPDVEDLFIEKVNPANPDQVEYKGNWEPMQVLEEKINVAGENEPVTLKVRITRHGPIINDVNSAATDLPPLALRWTGLDTSNLFASVLKLDRAQNWVEFRDGLKTWDLPSQNFVYADVDGNIGYQMPGRVPIRAKGDGSVPVPGWTGEYDWQGFIPFDQLPSLYNPAEGFIATANNAVVDGKYPFFISKDWDYGYRIRSIRALIQAKPNLSVEDVARIQGDDHSLFADEVLPYLDSLSISDDPLAREALAELRQWDRRSERDSVGAAVFEVFWLRLAHDLFDGPVGSDLAPSAIGAGTATKTAVRNALANPSARWWREAAPDAQDPRGQVLVRSLHDAAATLQAKLGSDISTWQWGRLHTVTFDNQTLGHSGISLIEGIFNRGPYPTDGAPADINNTGGNESLLVTSGPSWRMIVDMRDFSQSLAIHTTGESGHACNPHYDDMILKWIDIQYNPFLFTTSDVAQNTEATLTLKP